ncbi:MAG: sugar ABC transporter substrate-binding protein [Oscillospiraceae bacterium]|jgi:ribose transport system substrate-binding protein|nr:sugar ABC transporter substrate-binding protein [Oscillospiraceae bacterium]
MRNRKFTAIILALAIVLCLGLGACNKDEPKTGDPSGSDSPSASATSSASDSGGALSPEELANHEIYKHLGDNALMGVTPPFLKDRSAQNKALPVDQKSDVHVGWSNAAMVSAWFAGIFQGAEMYAEQYGYKLTFTDAIAWDVAKQTADVENMITMGIDILVIDPVDIQAQSIDVAKAIAAGIPVIGLYPMPDDVPVITAVTADYYEVSYQAGLNAAKLWNETIDSVFIVGQTGHPIADTRTCGFLAGWVYGKQVVNGTAKPYREDAMLIGFNAFKSLVGSGKVELPEYGLNVLGMANGYFDDVGGQAAAEDLLTAHPDVQMVFGCNDHQCAGAIKVLEQRGMLANVKVVTGCDADMDMLALVRDGKLESTGYNNPIAITKAVFELIHAIFEEGYDANNMPTKTPLYYELFTKANYMNVWEDGTEYGKVFDTKFKTIDELNAASK